MTGFNSRYFFAIRKFMTDRLGKEGFREAIKDLDPETKRIYNSIILTGRWYDIKHYEALQEIIYERWGMPGFQEYLQGISKKVLGGLFGLIIRFITVDKLIKNAQMMVERTYQGGIGQVTEADDHHIRFVLKNVEMGKVHRIGLEKSIKVYIDIATKKDSKTSSRHIDSTTTEYLYKF